MVGTVQDITDRKRAQEAIKESEERYRLVAENPIIGIGWTSLEGKILYVNEALCKMLGYTPDELHNVYFGDFTFPGDMEMELPLFEKLRSDKIKNYRVEKRYITKTGSPVWAELNLSLVTNASGFQYLIGIIQNINDRKVAEKERKKITADLIQRNSDLEQFTYIVSHNLRAPVANIIGFSEAIFDEVLGEDERKEVGTALYDSAHRLDEVVHDLNSILKIRIESDEVKELVNLSSIVESIRINSKQHIEKANAIIITDFSAVNELVSLKSFIYSIFYNLISNSIKYHRAEVDPVIEIKSALTIDKLILTFSDNGLGIDLSKRYDQVFGLYKRFHKHADGKGVGLFMVKTQVEALGGTINISSEVNRGTEFVIEFGA
jgi:PAS domain S-box-containing protein